MSTLTLAEAKTHLNITSTDHDAELQVFIDAAEAAIVAKCGPLAATATTETVTAASGMLLLANPPAISLTSVTPVDGGTALTVSDLRLDERAGVVYEVPDGTYTVVYSAGRSSVTEDLMQAVRELVRHLWQTQRGQTKRPGSNTSETTANTITGAAYLLPFRVSELIAPHMQAGLS